MSETGNKKLSLNPKAQQLLAKCAEQGLSDKEIQQQLTSECGYEWHVKSISRCRRNIGVVKKTGRPIKVDIPDSPMLASPPFGLNDVEKACWFKDQFKKTHMYQTIKKQFEPDEVGTYLEDFGLLCCQFEDIVVSEFMQIDDFLKHRILVDRQLVLALALQRRIDILGAWFIEHPKKDDEGKDTIKFRLMQQRQMDDFYKQLKVVNDRYDTLVKERAKIYSALNATRKDRLDELRGGEETFMDLVAKLQHSEKERNRHGRFAELTKLAAEDVAENFRKPNEFPDGSISPIIMDAKTNFSNDGVEIDE